MFSISDIKQEAYPAAYRRGKELYERGLVQEFSYDVYTEDGVPKAELIGRVKGTVEDHYDMRKFQRAAATVRRFATMRASASTVLPLRLPM